MAIMAKAGLNGNIFSNRTIEVSQARPKRRK
jgi:hypothetical protein